MSGIIKVRNEDEYNKLMQGSIIMNKGDNEIPLNNNITTIVIKFGAPWCKSCKLIENKYLELSKKYNNVIFAKSNIDKIQDLAMNLNISSLPTFIFYDRRNNNNYSRLITININDVEKKLVDVIKQHDTIILEDF